MQRARGSAAVCGSRLLRWASGAIWQAPGGPPAVVVGIGGVRGGGPPLSTGLPRRGGVPAEVGVAAAMAGGTGPVGVGGFVPGGGRVGGVGLLRLGRGGRAEMAPHHPTPRAQNPPYTSTTTTCNGHTTHWALHPTTQPTTRDPPPTKTNIRPATTSKPENPDPPNPTPNRDKPFYAHRTRTTCRRRRHTT